jgi:GNAT superfamily N-acetyltransferase
MTEVEPPGAADRPRDPAGDGPPRYTLRPIDDGDLPFLRGLYASTREEELAGVDWPAAQLEAFLDQQFAAQHRWYQEQYEGASFDVVEVAGEPAGRLYVARWPTEVRLVDVSLLPAWRGRGVGTALLQAVIAEASAAGKPVSIHVERMNRALGLYARLGFRLREDKGMYLLLERPL